jgi:hypothetical protein
MKKLDTLKINPVKLIRNEEMINLKGGDGRCCSAYDQGMWYGGTEPHATFCWSEQSLLDSWCSFWNSAGYQTHCNEYA